MWGDTYITAVCKRRLFVCLVRTIIDGVSNVADDSDNF